MTAIPNHDPVAVALIQAIRAGDLDALSALLAEHPGLAEARLEDRRGSRTPLHVATDWPGYFPNGPEVVRALLAAGADPDADSENPFGVRPLHAAAAAGDHDSARALLEAGADPNVRQQGGYTPLHSAAHSGDVELVRLLLVHGADPALVTDDGQDGRALATGAAVDALR